MSSNDDVIRAYPTSARHYKEPWPDIELPDGQLLPSIHYHHAIGKIITRWNRTELYFRILVGHACGLGGKTLDSLLTHVGSVTLREAAVTVARDVVQDEFLKEELEFVSALFDTNRVNRNFVAHSATDIMDLHVAIQRQPGVLATKRNARGGLSMKHYLLNLETLRKTADEIFACGEYISFLVGPIGAHREGKPERLPPRPPKPDVLASFHPTGDLFDLIQPHVRNEGPPD